LLISATSHLGVADHERGRNQSLPSQTRFLYTQSSRSVRAPQLSLRLFPVTFTKPGRSCRLKILCNSNFLSLQAVNHKPKPNLMKNKPSDYQKLRYAKKENIPNGGSVFTVTDFDEVDKSTEANQPDWRIRLTLDERWWFELKGGNLDTTIALLGDNFQHWIGRFLGLRVVKFTTKDCEEREYIKIVPAPEIQPSANIKSPRQSAEKTKRDSVLTVKHVS